MMYDAVLARKASLMEVCTEDYSGRPANHVAIWRSSASSGWPGKSTDAKERSSACKLLSIWRRSRVVP